MCIYHKDSKLLRRILKDYVYPARCMAARTPITMCEEMGQTPCLETICMYLADSELGSAIEFTREEFDILLKSGSTLCHEVISQMFRSRDKSTFETDEMGTSKFKMDQYKNHLQFLKSIKSNAFSEPKPRKQFCCTKLKKVRTKDCIDTQQDEQQNDINVKKKGNKRANPPNKSKEKIEAEAYTLPFAFDFTFGSRQSIDFLINYSKSKCPELVKSNWRLLIKHKWKQVKWLRYTMSFLYLICIILFTSLVAFDYMNWKMKFLLLAIIIFFLVMEVFELIGYVCYDSFIYFEIYSNYVDWAVFVFHLYYIFEVTPADLDESEHLKLFRIVALTLLFYRGLLYLEIINYFISIIYIIRTVVGKLSSFG